MASSPLKVSTEATTQPSAESEIKSFLGWTSQFGGIFVVVVLWVNLKQHPWQVGWEGSIPVGGRLLFCSGDPEVASVPAAPPSHNNEDPPISSHKFSNRGPHKLPAVGSCCSLKSKHRQPPLCAQHLLLSISKIDNMPKHQYGSKVRVLRVFADIL